MKKAVLLSLIFLAFQAAFAGGPRHGTPAPKAKSIVMLSGKIFDNDNKELLAGVKIICSNCNKVFYSDLNGVFFITLETESTDNLQLEFSQIGYSSKSLAVKELQTSGSDIAIDLKSE